MKIKFWGTRGSLPTPGPRTIKYGGNTSCVEIRLDDDRLIILDAGSGIRELGNHLMQQGGPIKAPILFSHPHWDHIQGLPFFTPAFIPGNSFTIMGCEEAGVDLSRIISDQMNPIYFPVELVDMASDIQFQPLYEGNFTIEGDVQLETLYLNHPGFTLGFRITHNDRTLVYVSDNEPYGDPDKLKSESVADQNDYMALFTEFIEDMDHRLVEFAQGADLFIHDAQYTPEEYKSRIKWGHSPYTYALDIAFEAKVKRIALFHHEPTHSDEDIDNILEDCHNIIKRRESDLVCFAAQERSEVVL